jgi:hypothetical protein
MCLPFSWIMDCQIGAGKMPVRRFQIPKAAYDTRIHLLLTPSFLAPSYFASGDGGIPSSQIQFST